MLIRVTPGIKASTHSYIQTGQADSKFGFPLADVERAVERCGEAGLEVRGLHAHIGSQVFELEAFEAVAEVLESPATGRSSTSAAGSGSPTPRRTTRRASSRTSRRCCARAARA